MKAAIVTGANSGIGLYITKKLSESGFHVFACSRKEAGFASFEGLKHVNSVLLDVTRQKTINEAVKIIKSSDHELVGVVNNAGTSYMMPVMYSSVDDYQRVIDVNVFGTHRLVVSFLDLLIENKGRVVNISSLSVIISARFSSHYTLSKHALEAYSDTLSKELRKFGVHISIVEPGGYDSNMGEKVLSLVIPNVEEIKDNQYGEEMSHIIENWLQKGAKVWPEPFAVADAVFHALSSNKPKMRYLVTDSKMGTKITIQRAIIELLQLNQDHKFTFSKNELIELLGSLYDQDPTELQFEYYRESKS